MTFEAQNGAAEAAPEVTHVEKPEAAPVATPATDSGDARRDAMAAVWDKMNQARDDAGKFAAKDGKPAEAAPSDPATKSEAAPEPSASVPPKATDAPKPPVSWPKDKTELWNTLDPTIREFVLNREREVEQGFRAKAEKYKPYDALIEELERRRPQLAAMGVTDPHQHYRALAAVEEAFARDPVATFAELAKRYRIDLGQIAGQQHPDTRVRELEARLAAIEAEKQREAQATYQNTVETLTAQIDAFAKNPANVHFERLRVEIAQLLQSGAAQNLADAYEKAVWANPETRALAIEAETKAAAEKAAKAAEAARKQASLNVRSSPAAPGKPSSLRDTMAATWDRLHS